MITPASGLQGLSQTGDRLGGRGGGGDEEAQEGARRQDQVANKMAEGSHLLRVETAPSMGQESRPTGWAGPIASPGIGGVGGRSTQSGRTRSPTWGLPSTKSAAAVVGLFQRDRRTRPTRLVERYTSRKDPAWGSELKE